MNPKLLSVLLAYPDEALLGALPELRAACATLPRGERRSLDPVLDAQQHAHGTGFQQAAACSGSISSSGGASTRQRSSARGHLAAK